MAHAAIELEEYSLFMQSAELKPEFAATRDNFTRVFAFFSGAADMNKTLVKFESPSAFNVKVHYIAFNPQSGISKLEPYDL